jgi:hypothetical protein
MYNMYQYNVHVCEEEGGCIICINVMYMYVKNGRERVWGRWRQGDRGTTAAH